MINNVKIKRMMKGESLEIPEEFEKRFSDVTHMSPSIDEYGNLVYMPVRFTDWRSNTCK